MLKKGTTLQIPHALTDIPEYAAATEKLAELRRRQTELQGKAGELQGLLRGDACGPNAIIMAKAKALIAGRTDEIERLAKVRADLERIQEDLAVVTEAIRLQEMVVESERPQANRYAIAAVLPEHKRLAGRIAVALRELTSALKDEQRFRDELETGGVVGIRNIAFQAGPDSLIEADSPIEQWFKEMADLGYV